MKVEKALEFVDQRLYAKTGKYLNDTEREVFIGSWRGNTYQEIYPYNPQYVEKTLAYRLWRKLSDVFGEKVTKKKIKGIVERAWQRQRQVFVSYRGQTAAIAATTLMTKLQALGHAVFIHDLNESVLLDAAAAVTDAESAASVTHSLQHCDCFILLLSPQAAVSEMLIEQLRCLRQEGVERTGSPPPVRVVIALEPINPLQLSHDLRNYLTGAYHWVWEPAAMAETLKRLQTILEQDIAALATQSLPCLTFPDELFEVAPEAGSLSTETETLAAASPSAVHPLPDAEPEIPSGLVHLRSQFYVERTPVEGKCYDEIGRSGALIRIKAPRQMGKTSLMARILRHAQEQDYQAIPISFQHADRSTFEDLRTLLRWFCTVVARRLRLPHRLDDYWEDTFGSKDNCTSYFQDYLLPAIERPLVLGLDEVDEVFRYPAIADDFFGLLRAWYEEANYGSRDSEIWERLRLVVVHSTEVYLPLDVNQSPFNVGLPIELKEFTPAQVTDLVSRYPLSFTPDDMAKLMTLVGGHPYLLQLALYYLAQQQLTLAELCATGPTEAGIYGDHLRRHLAALEQTPSLARAYRVVLDAAQPLQLGSEQAFKLHSLGLVRLQGNGVVPSFELYRRYFSDRLHIP
ncbi:MAG: molecular chaperone Tir [Leptolyngbya sp. SIOISBB]|nr:molecular chaperone Tir [Leptolyngbya sp. SIOISBB]